MKLLQTTQLDEPSPCPYLPGRQKRYEYFLGAGLSAEELGRLLAEGWRKFGLYYFRVRCEGCFQCIPLRVPVADFVPSRSQRRVLAAGRALQISFGPLSYDPRAFEIYRDHSRERFGDEVALDDFLYNFYLPSCPCLQSEIHLDGKMIGIGFLDRGADCLSSVYFCFDPRYAHLNLGTFSALQEIAHARSQGLDYYYLGYYVPGCGRMAYKDRFRPREHFDWSSRLWIPAAGC
ncbi:putative arginyl-tRNA--protein transferase [Desulfuromonas versatilis]|uniref:Arginyl-tRNA--protein transferase n=1 Tax=Desulfuromonas versatilis TaxID=2802975 RepID=A0ABM8HVL5_9BACT|nr:arginyltransferase [Desulfuromonas versatilis]BCR06044.1 putative arginyl-tRNA--protein transferase [Desulfuromonas versatilis]